MEESKSINKLDLGCGTPETKAPGHIGIDIVPTAEIIWDLNKGLPQTASDLHQASKGKFSTVFTDIEAIRCHQVVEHLDTIIPLLNDCYTVMKEGAILEISTPDPLTHAYWQDPTHKHGYVWETFLYFIKDSQFYSAQQEYGITARFSSFEHWMENGWNLRVNLVK